MKTVRHNTSESHSNPVRKGELPGSMRDNVGRTMAARYARFDADARVLVLPFGPGGEFRVPGPTDWGFEKMPDGYHWTAKGLFDLTGFPPAPPSQPKLTRPRYQDIFDEIQTEQSGRRIRGDRGDPFRCLPQLRQLRIMAEVQFARGALGEKLCYELAVALGNSRLVWADIDDADDFTLTPLAATLAAGYAISVAGSIERSTEAPASCDAFACEWVEARTQLWAASLTLEEAFEAAGCDHGAAVTELEGLLKTLRRWIGRVDGNLQRHMTLLRPAAGTYLLTNWRRLLAPCYRGVPPWWLDGCIG